MDYDNYTLKELLLRVGTVKRKIILQKLKNKLEKNGLTQQQVYSGLVQLVLRPRVHLTRLNIVGSLHLRSHVNKEIVECEESSPKEFIQENTAEVEPKKLSTTISTNETCNESDFVEANPCEKVDISSAAGTEIPELLAENVGNRIPTFIAKNPRKAITLNLHSHGSTKRPRIVEDVICLEGTIFNKSSFSNISEHLTKVPAAKKSKRNELMIEGKKEENDEEEEEELVSIMANAVEGKRENTNIEATKRCRLRKKLRQLFGKIVNLSEIEEEDELMNESIPKKRRKESRMSLDSGVGLSEVISERVTVSPDEFNDKIVEEMDKLPAKHHEINSDVLREKNDDNDSVVRSMPLLDSNSHEKIDNVFPNALPDISDNLGKNPKINIDNFGGKFKILITPFDSNGADTFAPMSLEFDLTSGSHVSTTTCTTLLGSEENFTGTKKKEENYDDFSTLFQLDSKKDCIRNQEDNTINILGENGTRVTANILVSTEKDAETKLLKADTAATSTKNFAGTSQIKCLKEPKRGDDSAVKCKDKVAFSENTETCFKDKIISSEVSEQKCVSSAAETLNEVIECEDSNQRTTLSISETCSKENALNQKNLNQKIVSPIKKTCNNENTSKSKNLDQISSTTPNINPQAPSLLTESALQIENIAMKNEVTKVERLAIKNKLPEIAVLAIKNKSTAIAPDLQQQINVGNSPQVQEEQINVNSTREIQEQLIHVDNTPEIQEKLINVDNTPKIQEQSINIENTSTNANDNKSSSNSKPKLRLLHHSELGSRWCPTPMNENVSSTSDNKSAQIVTPIQSCLQATNSAELLYPDNQLQYLPLFLGNAVTVTINNTPNLCNNSVQNCYNIPEKNPTYPPPGFFVPQRATTVKKVLLSANTNFLSSTTTSNTQNYYGNTAQNNYNTSGKQLINVSSDYSLPQGTTISKETSFTTNTNLLSSTTTNNTPNFYANIAPNTYNNVGKQSNNFSTRYLVSQETTITKESTIVANTNLSSSNTTSNSYNQEIFIRSNILGTQTVNLERTTSNEKTSSPPHTNFTSDTITTNLYGEDALVGHNMVKKVSISVPIDYSVVQGTTSNQKSLSPADINFSSSTTTKNNQSTQNVNNVPQKQLTNFSQATTSNQKSSSPANINFPSTAQNNNGEYSLDSIFSKVHRCLLNLQSIIKLSCMSIQTHERAKLQEQLLDNKKLLFTEIVKYCILLNTANIDVAIEDFVKRYEHIVEADQRQFDLKQVQMICRLDNLDLVNGVAQRQISHYPLATTDTISAPRCQYVKKNSTSRVAENKQRRCATAQDGLIIAPAIPQPGTSNSRTPPTTASAVLRNEVPTTFASAAPQSGTSSSRTPPTFVSGLPQNAATNSQITSTFNSAVPRSQFQRSLQPPAAIPLKRKHEFLPNYVYPAETLQRLNRQIEHYNILYRRLYYDLHVINMQDPMYRQLYRQKPANNILRQEELRRTRINIEQNITNPHHELRQRTVIPEQQEIASSQRRINNNSIFIPSTINNSRAQPNLSRGHVFGGNLGNIQNLVENFDINRKIAPQNPTNCSNEVRLPIPVENMNARQEMRQSPANSVQIIRNQMENIVESTLRRYLTMDNSDAKLQLQRNNAATVLQNRPNNSLENRADIAVSKDTTNPDLQIRPAAPFQPNTPQEAINNRNAQLELRLSSATIQQNASEEFRGSGNRIKPVSASKKQTENLNILVQESAAQIPTNCATSNGNATTSQLNSATQKSNRSNRKASKPEQMDDNAEWEVTPSNLKTSDQQRTQELKVRLKRVNISDNNGSDHRIELQQSSVLAAESDSVSAVISYPQREIQTSSTQSSALNQELVRENCLPLPCNNSSATDGNFAVNSPANRSELPQSSGKTNQKSIRANCSLFPCNDSTQTDENVEVDQMNNRSELRESSAVKIDDQALSNDSKIVEKLSSNRCNIKVVDVLEEFDAMSPKKKKKIWASTVAQNSASSLSKCLPLVTTIVPIDLIEESAKIQYDENGEENDLTFYQSDEESTVSAANKISVITIDDDDEFNLNWIEESKTGETVNGKETENEDFTSPQSVEIAEEEDNEIKEIASPENTETAEKEEDEIAVVTSLKNAETAENEDNEIIEMTLLKNSKKTEDKINEIEVTLQNSDIAVELEEQNVDRISCEIHETPEKISDEPMKTFSILDVKSISKDVFNNMRDIGDIEQAMSPKIEELKEADNLEIKDILLPNCSRCGKTSVVVCEQCYSAFYCSGECHHMHWVQYHHLSCKPVPEEARKLMH